MLAAISIGSHLAMTGLPVRSIKMVVGHEGLSTTLCCTRVSPQAIDDAVRVFESRRCKGSGEGVGMWRGS